MTKAEMALVCAAAMTVTKVSRVKELKDSKAKVGRIYRSYMRMSKAHLEECYEYAAKAAKTYGLLW